MAISYTQKVIISGYHVEVFEYKKAVWKDFQKKKRKPKLKQLNLFEAKSIRDKQEEEKKKKLKFSVNRTRTEMRRLINSNPILNKFITLTFAENEKDITRANYLFNQFIKRLNYRYTELQYIAVPEFQKRGAVHYHFLSNLPYIKSGELENIWGHGFIKIRRVGKVNNLGAYMSKYLGKELFSGRMFRKKKYFRSQNLHQSVELINWQAEKFIEKFISTSLPVYQKVFISEWIGEVDYRAYTISVIPFQNGFQPSVIRN